MGGRRRLLRRRSASACCVGGRRSRAALAVAAWPRAGAAPASRAALHPAGPLHPPRPRGAAYRALAARPTEPSRRSRPAGPPPCCAPHPAVRPVHPSPRAPPPPSPPTSPPSPPACGPSRPAFRPSRPASGPRILPARPRLAGAPPETIQSALSARRPPSRVKTALWIVLRGAAGRAPSREPQGGSRMPGAVGGSRGAGAPGAAAGRGPQEGSLRCPSGADVHHGRAPYAPLQGRRRSRTSTAPGQKTVAPGNQSGATAVFRLGSPGSGPDHRKRDSSAVLLPTGEVCRR